MIDQSSLRRFSTGVPVMAIRRSRRDRPHALGRPGRAVLYLLRLVEDEAAPGDGGEQLAGRGRRDRRSTAPGPPCAALRVKALPLEPVRSVVDVDRQFGCEACRLSLPVADEGHRAEDERRSLRYGTALPAAARGAARSSRAPCRRRGTLRDRDRPGTRATRARAPGRAAARPTKPSGVGRAFSRRSSAPARRSPSHPSASTAATGRSPEVGSIPRAVRTTSPADMRSGAVRPSCRPRRWRPRCRPRAAPPTGPGSARGVASGAPAGAARPGRSCRRRAPPPTRPCTGVEPDGRCVGRARCADGVRALSRRPTRASRGAPPRWGEDPESRLFQDRRAVAEELERAGGVGDLRDGHPRRSGRSRARARAGRRGRGPGGGARQDASRGVPAR